MTDRGAKTQQIRRVTIVEGCILCGLCEDTCPEVFRIEPESAVVRPAAGRYLGSHALQVLQAVKECPVHVIKIKRSPPTLSPVAGPPVSTFP